MIPLIIALLVSAVVIWRFNRLEKRVLQMQNVIDRLAEAVRKTKDGRAADQAKIADLTKRIDDVLQDYLDAESKVAALTAELEAIGSSFDPSGNEPPAQ
jgi:septal ring factor EnvC (AmiA/AmiB activator)